LAHAWADEDKLSNATFKQFWREFCALQKNKMPPKKQKKPSSPKIVQPGSSA